MTEKAIQVWDGDGARMHGNPHDRTEAKKAREKFADLATWEDQLNNQQHQQSTSVERLLVIVQEAQENASWFRSGARRAAGFLTGIGFAMLITAPFLFEHLRDSFAYAIPGFISFFCGAVIFKYCVKRPHSDHSMEDLRAAFTVKDPRDNHKPARPPRPEPEQTRGFMPSISGLLPKPPKPPRGRTGRS